MVDGADPYTVVAYSRDGRFLAGASAAGARVWDTATGGPIGPRLVTGDALGGSDPVELRFSADGSRLLARGPTGAVVRWTITDKRPAGPSVVPTVPAAS